MKDPEFKRLLRAVAFLSVACVICMVALVFQAIYYNTKFQAIGEYIAVVRDTRVIENVAVKGDSGYTPILGIDYFNGTDGISIKGDKGEKGDAGSTTIIENSYNIPGEKGDKGDQGQQGTQGMPGISSREREYIIDTVTNKLLWRYVGSTIWKSTQ